MTAPPGPDPRIIALTGGVNFRDLGGYTGAGGRCIRWQHLYRSGATHLLDAAARQQLRDMGIRVAVDFRSTAEQREHPHGLSGMPEVTYLAAPHGGLGGNLMQMLAEPALEAAHLRAEMLQLYRTIPFDFGGVFQLLFRGAAHGPLPLVFSCAAGKDRTGVAAALLLRALGVSWAQIEADYLLTERFVPDIMRALRPSHAGRRLAQVDPGVIAPVFSADREYLHAMRTAIEERCGSLETYFNIELQLEPGVIETLRERLLV
jgi:protein-tyrosine phosphatase